MGLGGRPHPNPPPVGEGIFLFLGLRSRPGGQLRDARYGGRPHPNPPPEGEGIFLVVGERDFCLLKGFLEFGWFGKLGFSGVMARGRVLPAPGLGYMPTLPPL